MFYEENLLHAFEIFLFILPNFGTANDYLILGIVLETVGRKDCSCLSY